MNINCTKIEYIDFKNFFIENNIEYSRPDFSEIYFGCYDENRIIGVLCYSRDYSLKNSIWSSIEFRNPLKISFSYFLNEYNKFEKDLIIFSLNYLKIENITTFISNLVDINNDQCINFFNNMGWYNLGYISGSYYKKNSKLRFVIYLSNEEYYNNKLKFLYNNYNKDVYGLIYSITNTINNKKYFGQTIRGLFERYSEYKTLYNKNITNSNEYLYNSFIKYGFDKFKFEVIELCSSIDELNEKEKYYISIYDTTNRNFGYNIHEGGRNSPLSEETKRKMSEVRKGIPKSELWKESAIAPAGSEEAKKYGKPKTDEEKKHLSENSPKYWLGKKRDEETIRKVSESKKLAGLKPPNSKRLVMLDSDGKLVKIYDSANDCSHDSGYSYEQIYARLAKRYENNLDHKFYYLEDYKGEYNIENDLYIKPKDIDDKKVIVREIKKVVICNSNNEYIKTVSTVVEASKYTGVHQAAIRRRLEGKHRNQGDYYFHFENDWNIGNIDRFVESDRNKPMGVIMFNTITGENIKEYSSINEAANDNFIDAGIIRRKCEGKKSRQSLNNSKLDNNISFRYK